jgi:hypothetical protein
MFCGQWPSVSWVTPQVVEDPPHVARRSSRQEPPGRLHQVPRPDEVIASEVLIPFGEPPRNREAGDDVAPKGLGLVGAQDGRADAVEVPAAAGARAGVRDAGRREPLLAVLPAADVVRQRRVEALRETGQGTMPGLGRARAEADGQDEGRARSRQIDLAVNATLPFSARA